MVEVGFSQEDIDLLMRNVDQLDESEVRELYDVVDDLAERQRVQRLRDDLIAFCQHMQSDYKVGAHHRRLADLLEDVEARRKDRICVSIPPRHGKSQLVSIYYAAWYMGKNPGHKIMLVSHTTDLAVDFGRKIRNIISSNEYKEVFPDVSLASDSKSAGRWNTNHGGEFFAAGVGSALAGRGAHLLLVDDPHSEQDILNGNYGVFKRAYEWFTYGARTRLMPGGAIAIVHCMTGDTGVLRPDGTETPLRDIRPGDMIASYENGRLVNKKVLNWANQGPDHIYTLRMNNDKLIRANVRHPFLVVRNGVEVWVKVKDLRAGDELVSLTDAAVKQSQKAPLGGVKSAKTERNVILKNGGLARRFQSPKHVLQKAAKIFRGHAQRLANARHVYPETTTTRRTLTLSIAARGIGARTRAKLARSLVALNRHTPKICALGITTGITTNVEKKLGWLTTLSGADISICGPVTASSLSSMPTCANVRATDVPYAKHTPARSQSLRHGGKTTLLQSTIAMIRGTFARFCATRAISLYTAGRALKRSKEQFSTSEIISITPDGVEDVFDIQVEDTENFIANGVVSHNTRWSLDDLIGRVVRDMANNEIADEYEVFEFPAVLSGEDPETGKVVDKALWPEFFDLKALMRTKASMPVFQWNAQYQQDPTAEEAAVVKREWWRRWKPEKPPPCDYIVASLDAAAETHNRADYTGLTIWGVFLNEEEEHHQIILLHAIKDRYEFPELKRLALDVYEEWEPDCFIVEKKSAGVALYQELRRTGLPIQEYTPHRGSGDKLARLNSVADIISSGMVWMPEHRWAEEVIEEIAGFPFASNDDLVDSAVMALMRFRQGGFVALPTDYVDEPDFKLPNAEGYY